MIEDKGPELTEEFTIKVTRADGQTQETTYDQAGPLDPMGTARAALNESMKEAWDDRLSDLAREVSEYERRRSDQT